MAVVRTIPSKRIINGNTVVTSEISVVSELDYRTHGESKIVVRGIAHSNVVLDSSTTDHIVVKAMTNVTIIPDIGKIDEEYDEIILDKFACVEFLFVNGHWYILSSDGLKQS